MNYKIKQDIKHLEYQSERDNGYIWDLKRELIRLNQRHNMLMSYLGLEHVTEVVELSMGRDFIRPIQKKP